MGVPILIKLNYAAARRCNVVPSTKSHLIRYPPSPPRNIIPLSHPALTPSLRSPAPVLALSAAQKLSVNTKDVCDWKFPLEME